MCLSTTEALIHPLDAVAIHRQCGSPFRPMADLFLGRCTVPLPSALLGAA